MDDIFLEEVIQEIYGVDINSIEVDINEAVVVHRQSKTKRIQKARSRRKAHRGTNWNSIKPKTGFKRVKIGNKYVRQRMSSSERISRKRVGKAVGAKSRMFR